MAAVLAPCWNCERGQTGPCRCWRSPVVPDAEVLDIDAVLDRELAEAVTTG